MVCNMNAQNPSFTRGIQAVHANASAPQLLAQLKDDFESWKKQYDGRIDEAEAAADQANTKIAAMLMNGSGNTGSADVPVDPEYSRAFRSWIQSGENETEVRAANTSGRLGAIRASMSEGVPGNGGYLAPIEWDRRIIAAEVPLSPMRRLATVVQTGVRGFTTLWNLKGWGTGWVGETAARPETTSANFAEITFTAGTIYAQPSVTQDLLDDSEINAGQFIAEEIAGEFAIQESLAFIAGDGVNKPNGLLTYAAGAVNAASHPGGALDTVTVAATASVTTDELIDFTYGLAAPYRRNASWLMNSTTASALAKLKDSNGDYLWRESVSAGQPRTLLGYPVEFDENMPDMAANALPIAFGDFRRGYVINDRLGTSILRDPYTNKPYVMFYARKRVGAGLRDPRALRVLKMAAV